MQTTIDWTWSMSGEGAKLGERLSSRGWPSKNILDPVLRAAGMQHTAAFPFYKSVKIVFRQELIQALVKGMGHRSSHGATWNPQLLLTLCACPIAIRQFNDARHDRKI